MAIKTIEAGDVDVDEILGSSVERREDPALITGRAEYTDDIQRPNMVHMAVVRSPYGHAKVLDVDTTEAENMDGVIAVYTAEDFDVPGEIPVGWLLESLRQVPHPILASDRVRYQGDGVAVVVAEERAIAADANDPNAAADGDVTGTTVGVPTELVEGVDAGVRERFDATIADLESAGATVEEVSLPSVEHAVAAYYVIAMSEASSNLARYDGVRYGISGGYEGNWNEAFAAAREAGFGAEVKRRILLGTYALSAGYQEKYYKKAQDARAWVRQDFESALESVDVLATPTMPVTPPRLGESLSDPLTMYLADANTVPVNLANLPAISVPMGDVGGLPVGMQFVGPAFGEEVVVRAGSAVEGF